MEQTLSNVYSNATLYEFTFKLKVSQDLRTLFLVFYISNIQFYQSDPSTYFLKQLSD